MNEDVSLQSAPLAPSVTDSRPAPDVQGERARVCEAIHAALLSSRNSDGGWPYAAGRRSRIEPTCWALLALARADGREPDVDVLRRWPRQDGWLADVAGVPPNHAFNALAGLVLDQVASTRPLADAIASRVAESRGLRVGQSPEMRQDNSLQAWSWVDGTFSWVEPTAWCLLLLKQRRARAAGQTAAGERIAVGERMLLDRVCRNGGWNYGNSNVYGQELWPYVPTTAAALLAMQDRRGEAAVRESVARLAEKVRSERSAVALALSIVCLRVFGQPVGAVEADLVAYATGSAARDGDINHMGLAMTLYALANPTRPVAPFELA